VLAATNGGLEPVHVARWKLDALFLGNVEDGLQPERAVEMDVQVRLRQSLKHLERDGLLDSALGPAVRRLVVFGVVFHGGW
jgi:hypothetical protein